MMPWWIQMPLKSRRVSESLGESCDVNVNNPKFGDGFYLFLRGPFFLCHPGDTALRREPGT